MHQLEADWPQDLRDSVGLAFHELLMNSIEWGGHLKPSETIRVACHRTRRMFLYRIADPGRGFKLQELPHAAPTDGRTRSRTTRSERIKSFAPALWVWCGHLPHVHMCTAARLPGFVESKGATAIGVVVVG